MKDGKKLAQMALAAVVSASLAHVSTQAVAAAQDYVKCYGVAATGKNDCGTVVSSCAATIKEAGACYAWIFTPKGLCEKIAHSSVGKPAADCKNPNGNKPAA